MNRIRLALLASVFLITLGFTSAIQAQAPRTWVSGVGDDVNPCSRTAPCKTFAGAIAKTALGGEIDVLDPGGFGTLTISKSITVDGTGMLASALSNGTTGFTIKITDPKDTAKAVRLRGLSINGLGSGVNGINIIAANKVSVEETVIDGFTASGINVGAGQLFVKNVVIRNNAVAGITAVAGTQVGLTDVSVVFNGTGLVGPAGTITQFDNVVLFGNVK